MHWIAAVAVALIYLTWQWWYWLILPIILFAIAFYSLKAEKKEADARAEQDAIFRSLRNFRATSTYTGGPGRFRLSVDDRNRKIAITNGSSYPEVINFSDLVAVEIVKNGSTISRTNRGSQVAGAAIGGLLLGPLGLLIGGVTGSKRQEEKVRKLSLRIIVNQIANPMREVVFYDEVDLKSDHFSIVSAAKQLEDWDSRFKAILASKSEAPTPVTSVALPAPASSKATSLVLPASNKAGPIPEASWSIQPIDPRVIGALPADDVVARFTGFTEGWINPIEQDDGGKA